MAVAITTTDFPEGVGTDMYDGVQAAMDIANNPPAGLLFHWAGEVEGKWTITDVWESRDAYDSFRDERLFPAIREVSGMDPADAPQPTITESEVHDYIKP
jgi:quinol monooxygenase YgiN